MSVDGVYSCDAGFWDVCHAGVERECQDVGVFPAFEHLHEAGRVEVFYVEVAAVCGVDDQPHWRPFRVWCQARAWCTVHGSGVADLVTPDQRGG